MNTPLYAHISQSNSGEWLKQTLSDHLEGVADLAEEFASPFESEKWGRYVALLHDFGKSDLSWQSYLACASGYDTSSKGIRGSHSSPGAVVAYRQACTSGDPHAFLSGRAAAYIIACHHSGLIDFSGAGSGSTLDKRIPGIQYLGSKALSSLKSYSPKDPFMQSILHVPLPKLPPAALSTEGFSLWIRMLFSALVDADSLNAEAFERGCGRRLETHYAKLSDLLVRLESHLDTLQSHAEDTKVNRMRKEVLQECRDAAEKKPGIFTLTVPTGGGKTLAAMDFALRHAIQYDKRRIIMAIPYTSIIEQNAQIYKYGTTDPAKIRQGSTLFGKENVIEHHSNFKLDDNEADESRTYYQWATENWEAPIIVTTNVQLFESLLSSRKSSCRKIHNIANSVIILDEAQMLPYEQYTSLLSTLKQLVKHYRVTLVLCTATQPAFFGTIGMDKHTCKGFDKDECREIVSSPEKLAQGLKRTEITFDNNDFEPLDSWETLASDLSSHRQVLCIVDTRQDCLDLYDAMPEGTWHLSAGMCPEERSDCIAAIKNELRDNKEVRVISTQLIEAGVDIDFPYVFRALSGLDSIAQAAGRCNREGKQDNGIVTIFKPPKLRGHGFQKKRAQSGENIVKSINMKDCLSPTSVARYFEYLYDQIDDFDKGDFKTNLVNDATEAKFNFKTFSNNLHLIDDHGQHSIVVRYASTSGEMSEISSVDLIDKLLNNPESLTKNDYRMIQRFSVTVFDEQYNELKASGLIADTIIEDLAVQCDPNLYIPGRGICCDADQSPLII